MSNDTTRGYTLSGTLAHIEQNYDEATRTKMLDGLSPDLRATLRSINDVGWYPVAQAGELFGVLVAHHRETDGKPELALERVGRTLSSRAMNTFLKLLMKLMTPGLFARKLPDFWSRDNRCGTLDAVFPEGEKQRILVTMRGVSEFHYIQGAVPGFVSAALEAMGCKNVKMTSDWTAAQPGADVVKYDARWD